MANEDAGRECTRIQWHNLVVAVQPDMDSMLSHFRIVHWASTLLSLAFEATSEVISCVRLPAVVVRQSARATCFSLRGFAASREFSGGQIGVGAFLTG